jgi:hypothetical protein
MKRYKFGADFLHPEFKKFVYAFSQEQLRASRGTGTCTSVRQDHELEEVFAGPDCASPLMVGRVNSRSSSASPTRRTDIKLESRNATSNALVESVQRAASTWTASLKGFAKSATRPSTSALINARLIVRCHSWTGMPAP